MKARASVSSTIAILLAAAFAACGDPVHDNEVTALGPEAAGVSPGPTHRPGQPCLTCHGGDGPASAQFAFAGTLFQIPIARVGYSGMTVNVTDVNKKTASATSNSVGNFYIMASDYAPTYPVDVELDQGTFKNPMVTHIGRDGSCGSCHFDPTGPSSPGHVYVAGDVSDLPNAGAQ